MAKARKDNKGRALRKGEVQRSQDGRYVYTYTNPVGKRCYIYANTLMELREKEDELKRDQLDGIDSYVAGKADLDFLVDRYMATKNNLASSTYANYRYTYDHFCSDGFGKRKVTELRYSDVLNFYLSLIDKGIKVKSVESLHCVLHPAFDMAVRDDIIRKNPTDGVLAEIKRNSGKNKGIRHALTIEQQQAFMDTIRTFPEYYHWYPLFATLLGTGMRIGECTGLTWNDVDFKRRCISVNHAATYYTRNGVAGFAISRPKTEAGIRQIPMMDAVYNALKNEYDRQKKDGFCTYELDGVSGFIFSNKLGLLHNPHCVNLAIKRIYEAHNAREIIAAKREHREPVIIPHFSCHVLRHTFCSRLCESDMNVKVIQEIMGHKNVETTLDIYTEVNYNKKKDSLEELASKMQFF